MALSRYHDKATELHRIAHDRSSADSCAAIETALSDAYRAGLERARELMCKRRPLSPCVERVLAELSALTNTDATEST